MWGAAPARPRDRRPPPADWRPPCGSSRSTGERCGDCSRPRPLPARRRGDRRDPRTRSARGARAAPDQVHVACLAHARVRVDVAVAGRLPRRRADRPVPEAARATCAPTWRSAAADAARPATIVYGTARCSLAAHRDYFDPRPTSSSSAASTRPARPTTRCSSAEVTADDGDDARHGRELRLPPDDARVGEHALSARTTSGRCGRWSSSTPAPRACSCKGRPATSARGTGSSATRRSRTGTAGSSGSRPCPGWRRCRRRGRASSTPGRSSPGRRSASGSTSRSTRDGASRHAAWTGSRSRWTCRTGPTCRRSSDTGRTGDSGRPRRTRPAAGERLDRPRDCRAHVERMTRQLARLACAAGRADVPVPGRRLAGSATRCGCSPPASCTRSFRRRSGARFPETPSWSRTLTNDWQPGYLPTAASYGYGIYQETIAVVGAGQPGDADRGRRARAGRRCRKPNPDRMALGFRRNHVPRRHRIPLRKADLAGDQRRRRPGQGLHRPVRGRRAAWAAPAARCRSRLPRRHRHGGRAGDPGQDARAADRRLRLHRARDGLSRHDQQRLRALHAPRARHHQVAGLPRLQEDRPAQRPRLEHAEPRPGRPPHESGDRRRVRLAALVEPADRRQGVPAALAAEQVPRRLRARLRAGNVALPVPRRRQRAQGPDQERHDLVQRGGQPVQLGRSVRGRARRRSISWTSSYSETGVLGDAELATAEKGARPTKKPSSSSCASSPGSRTGPKDQRRDRHRKPPTMPIPWGQQNIWRTG